MSKVKKLEVKAKSAEEEGAREKRREERKRE